MDTSNLPTLINDFLGRQLDSKTFREKLYPVVVELLMNNTAQLYQALYRIDVKEEKVKMAFNDNPMVEVAAERITELIIARQLEKIQWREKYKK